MLVTSTSTGAGTGTGIGAGAGTGAGTSTAQLAPQDRELRSQPPAYGRSSDFTLKEARLRGGQEDREAKIPGVPCPEKGAS